MESQWRSQVVTSIGMAVGLMSSYLSRHNDRRLRRSAREIHARRSRLQTFVRSIRADKEALYDFTRLQPAVFDKLLRVLTTEAVPCLQGTNNTRLALDPATKLALFLHICGTGAHYRAIRAVWGLALSYISRVFNSVLRSVLWLHGQLVKEPTRHTPQHPKVGDPKACGFAFRDAIGAIDGSHVHAHVRTAEQMPYRNRKGFISQNVLAAVDFDGNFLFVLAGWEGSAHDGRVYQAAVSQHGFTKGLPRGKYYLADAGYSQSARTIVPYRGVRYHLKEWKSGADAPQTVKELFNHRHSGLRIVVERVFGVFKRRFQIFQRPPPFPFATQRKLVYALTGLHNFINYHTGFTSADVDQAEPDHDRGGDSALTFDWGVKSSETQAADALRQRIGEEMFLEYAPRHGLEDLRDLRA